MEEGGRDRGNDWEEELWGEGIKGSSNLWDEKHSRPQGC